MHNKSVPKATIGGAFGDRRQEFANGMGWNNEDRQFVDKLSTGELHATRNGDRACA